MQSNNNNTDNKDTSSQYFFYDTSSNSIKGPFDYSKMEQLWMNGSISTDTYICPSYAPKWVTLLSLGDLEPLLDQPQKKTVITSSDSDESKKFLSSTLDEWYYISEDNKNNGPISKINLLQLSLNNTIIPTTMCWKYNMNEWKPLHLIEELKDIFPNFTVESSDTWHIIDLYREKHSYLSPPQIADMLVNNKIDNRCLCWKQELTKWKPLEEIVELKEVISNTNELAKLSKKDKSSISNSNKNTKDKTNQNQSKSKINPLKHLKDNTSVYVKGLPLTITEEQLYQYFKKCGVIKEDEFGKPIIKIYEDEQGKAKGDASITYLLQPSVALAIQILDETEIEPNYKISVEVASFKKKGKKTSGPKRKLDQKTLELKRKKYNDQLRQVSWSDGIEEERGFRIIILKNMFNTKDAPIDESSRKLYFDDLSYEVGVECEKKCGEVEKLTVFENNPEGVIAVKFISPSAAEECIKLMNGRYFGKKQISCEYFDGITNYSKESEESEEKRLEEFGKWLEEE